MVKKTKGGLLVNGLIIALFIFAGNMLLVGKGNLVELLLASVLGSLALPVAFVAAVAVFGEGEKKGGAKIFFVVLATITVMASVYVASLAASEFSHFVEDVMLLSFPRFAVAAIFLALCSYLASKGSAVRKFSFAAAVIVFAAILLLLVLSLESFKIERIGELWEMEVKTAGVVNLFSSVFAPAVIAVIYLSSNGEGRVLSSVLGTAIAILLLSVCFLNVLLLLGGSFGASEPYPYSTAVSTVTAGKLFARMEGFAYIMYYASELVRGAVCIALVSLLVERITGKKWRALPYATGLLVLLVTLLLSCS